MAKKIEKPAAKLRTFYFPTLGVSVEAASYEEALSLAQVGEKEAEEGDDSI